MGHIDAAAIAQVRELDAGESLMVELVTYFVTDANAAIVALHDIVGTNATMDTSAVSSAVRLIHTLKSSSGCVGATNVVQLAGTLEQQARSHGTLPPRQDLDLLAAAVENACEELLRMFPAAGLPSNTA